MDRRRIGVTLVATVAFIALVAGCSGSAPDDEGAAGDAVPSSPSVPTPSAASPTPDAAAPAIPDGRYVQTAPVTRAEALDHGLHGADVRENLGLFTLELEAGAFTLSQRPPEPVEFPLIIGAYAWTARGLVLTPSTFRGQVWTLRASVDGDRVRFRVVHVTSTSFAPSAVRAGVSTIFETHPWVARP
jgi:hypothetical protein